MSPFSHDEFLVTLANGNFHRAPSLRAAEVGTVRGFTSLRQEVEEVMANEPPSVVSSGHHTNWTQPWGTVKQWSLWTSHGDTSNTSEDFNYVLSGKRVHGDYPTLQGFASTIPSLVNLRINCMLPNSGLSPHEEHLPRKLSGGTVGMRARFHLPIQTNANAEMLADDEWFHFDAGNVYLFNNGCVHGAVNEGDTNRVHLVWDQLMTKDALNSVLHEGTAFIDSYWRFLNSVHEEQTGSIPSPGMSVEEFDNLDLVVHP